MAWRADPVNIIWRIDLALTGPVRACDARMTFDYQLQHRRRPKCLDRRDRHLAPACQVDHRLDDGVELERAAGLVILQHRGLMRLRTTGRGDRLFGGIAERNAPGFGSRL